MILGERCGEGLRGLARRLPRSRRDAGEQYPPRAGWSSQCSFPNLSASASLRKGLVGAASYPDLSASVSESNPLIKMPFQWALDQVADDREVLIVI